MIGRFYLLIVLLILSACQTIPRRAIQPPTILMWHCTDIEVAWRTQKPRSYATLAALQAQYQTQCPNVVAAYARWLAASEVLSPAVPIVRHNVIPEINNDEHTTALHTNPSFQDSHQPTGWTVESLPKWLK